MKAGMRVAAIAILMTTSACDAAQNTAGTANNSATVDNQLSDAVPQVDPAAMQSAAGDPQVQSFYKARNWQAAWSPRAAAVLKKILDDRAANGLDRVNFLPANLDGLQPAAKDAALTKAALQYAGALANGMVDPKSLYKVYTIPQPKVDVAAGLTQAMGGDLAKWFAGLVPQTPEYQALSQAYLQKRQQAAKGDIGDISATGEAIHVGDHDPRVPEIRTVLQSNGYLIASANQPAPPPPTPTPTPAPAQQQPDQAGQASPAAPAQTDDTLYTRQMANAVKAIQRDYGISDDGVVGPDTLKVLNSGPGDQARTLAVALERLRWVKRDPPATRIDVNIAAAELNYFRNGQLADHRDVIVGQPGKETPQLLAPMFRLVANPTWTVPRSIQEGEMKGKGADYFRKNHLEWKNGWIVQKSGPFNSLGLVKFDLRDDQAIYLHDTDARSLFSKNQRQLSHGCVRVHDALGFAQMIAKEEGIDSQWEKARATGKETFVRLPKQIPVYLMYHTVFTDPSGQVTFRTDPYGWDTPIAQKLGFAEGHTRQFETSVNDIGP